MELKNVFKNKKILILNIWRAQFGKATIRKKRSETRF